MSEQERLMRRINAYRFALWELHIYLDTHPGDCHAAQKHAEYQKTVNELIAQYEAAYGPMNESPKTASRWAWISDPWPWDPSEEAEK
ncbi:MAG: spore coat protein CotJB [Ruminococcaceae bacterium]|nr:spore coat protein CotJB [Oscillospiraceae bacterium]